MVFVSFHIKTPKTDEEKKAREESSELVKDLVAIIKDDLTSENSFTVDARFPFSFRVYAEIPENTFLKKTYRSKGSTKYRGLEKLASHVARIDDLPHSKVLEQQSLFTSSYH